MVETFLEEVNGSRLLEDRLDSWLWKKNFYRSVHYQKRKIWRLNLRRFSRVFVMFWFHLAFKLLYGA